MQQYILQFNRKVQQKLVAWHKARHGAYLLIN